MKQYRPYHPAWNLSTIPDNVLMSEYKRRASLRREVFAGGRPVVLRPCPFCRKEFGAAELRKHKPECPKKKAA